MRNLTKLFILCSLVIVFTLLLTNGAFADGTVMNSAQQKARNVFTAVRTIIFIVGGFGLVGIAFQAIFGKVKWSWFAGLAVGLGILAAANAVIQYAAGSNADTEVEDTFEEEG